MPVPTARSALQIGLDGFNLSLPHGTGVATYGRNLSYALKHCGYSVDVLYGMDITANISPALREVMFFDQLGEKAAYRPAFPLLPTWWKETLQDAAGRKALEVPLSNRVDPRTFADRLPAVDRILNAWNIFRRAEVYYQLTGRFLRITVPNPPAIMHWTYPLPIEIKNAINIYTIHDLVPLRLPYTTKDNKKNYYRLIRDICKNQPAICTVSDSSKQEIVSFFPDAEKKIHVPYQSVHDLTHVTAPHDTQGYEGMLTILGLCAGEYYMFIGSMEPKKNLSRLITSFLSYNTPRKLLVVGSKGWKNEQDHHILKRGIESGRVVHTDYLPRPVLAFLLQRARALLFPSIAEGFGLPVLEAFQAGTPVLSSTEGGLKEVCGKAALLVDAFDPASITHGLATLDQDETLLCRLKEKGFKQAEYFSMKNFSTNLSQMYEKILAQ